MATIYPLLPARQVAVYNRDDVLRSPTDCRVYYLKYNAMSNIFICDDAVVRAYELWENGESFRAAGILFEKLPSALRPIWAARIMRLVHGKSRLRSSRIERACQVADSPSEWKNAHAIFTSLREETLKLDRLRAIGLTEEQELLGNLLSLAELVAKVTYNATNPPDQFDDDSGFWIGRCLRGFVDHHWSDSEFSDAAWKAMSFQEAVGH